MVGVSPRLYDVVRSPQLPMRGTFLRAPPQGPSVPAVRQDWAHGSDTTVTAPDHLPSRYCPLWGYTAHSRARSP